MLAENISFAEKFLMEALSEYEGNGTRYEPADRQALIDLINELHDLSTRLTLFMANLPYLDHHPIDTSIVKKTGPVTVADVFEVLERSKYISPAGPIVHSVAYQSLKKIFENTTLTVIEAQHILHRENSN
jgi:hypothetical protein